MEQWQSDFIERLKRELLAWELIHSSANATLLEAQKAEQEARYRLDALKRILRGMEQLCDPDPKEIPF